MNRIGSTRLAAWVAGVLLAGCGGGDDGGSASSTNRAPGLPQLPGTIVVDEDVPYSAQVAASDPDGDALTFSVATAPAHGQLTVSAAGNLSYTPAANYNGTDQFAVQVRDPGGATSASQFNVTIRPVNDAR